MKRLRDPLLPFAEQTFEGFERVRTEPRSARAGFAGLINGFTHSRQVDRATPRQLVVCEKQVVPGVTRERINLKRGAVVLNGRNWVTSFVIHSASYFRNPKTLLWRPNSFCDRERHL